jgi:hypothetical protein
MSTSPPPAPRRPRPFDAVKWFGLAVLLTGVGVGAQAALGQKADTAEVRAVETRVNTNEREIATLKADAKWIKYAIYALTLHEGVTVPPPPKD